MGEPGIQDFLRVGRADGGHLVGHLDGTLHEVDAAVLLHDGSAALRNAKDILQDFHAVFALVLDVMNGENRFDVFVPLPASVEQAVIHRNQGGLPVVGVDDIGFEINVRQHFQNRPGQERKPLRVVVMAVKAGALEIILVVQQIVNHAVVAGLEHAAILPPPGHGNRQAGQEGHVVPQLLRNRFIQGQYHAAADQPHPHRMGQRSRHIRQAA